jgi:threonine dehydrogenase-like Zn-dependent dehydrogenase
MASVLGPVYQGRLSYVKLVCDVNVDAAALQKATPGGKGADFYIDFSPAVAAKSTHIKSCLMALKTFGKAAFQGGIQDEVSIPYGLVMLKSLRIQGRFMFDRSVVARLVGMLEAGIVKLGAAAGVKIMGPYGLDKINEALETAEQNNGWGSMIVVAP